MNEDQLTTLRDVLAREAPEFAKVLDRSVGAAVPGGDAEEEAEGAEERDGLDADDDLAAKVMRQNLEYFLDGKPSRPTLDPVGVDPERAIRAAAANAARSDDEPLPAGRTKGKASPLGTLKDWARSGRGANDRHPARAGRGRR